MTACALAGPDLTIDVPGDELALDSWLPQRPNAKPKVVVPEGPPGWSQYYVRTALVRPSGWRPGAKGPSLRGYSTVVAILDHMRFLDHERVVTLCMDDKWRLIAIHEAGVGGLHGCALLAKDILRVPVLTGARRFLLAHNHPSGDPTPSGEDVAMTNVAFHAAEALGIHFVDHVVLAHGSYDAVGKRQSMLGFKGTGADTVMTVAERSFEELAMAPFGKYSRLVVRTAVLMGSGRGYLGRFPQSRMELGPQLGSFEAVAQSPVVVDMRSVDVGVVATFCLNARNELLGVNVRVGEPYTEGVAGVFGTAVTVPSSAVIIAHNNPDARAPSRDDIAFHRRLKKGLEALHLPLLDHLLVTRRGAVSLTE